MDNAIDPRTVATPASSLRGPFAWLAQRFGTATKLEEREKHAPPLAYLLTGAVSLASILVFAHNDIPVIFGGDLAASVVAAVQVAVIVTAVIVGDLCVVRSYYRLEMLRLRGATGMFAEHVAYMVFVMTVNISTYFSVSQANIHALLSGAPIIPDHFLLAEEIARAVVVGWTAMQLLITSDKLLVQWSTIMRETAELLGGKALDWLKSLNIDLSDPVSIFTAYGAVVDSMARSPRRAKAQARHAAAMAAAAAQRQQVIDAIKAFGRDRLEEARSEGIASAAAEAARQFAAAQAEIAAQIAAAQAEHEEQFAALKEMLQSGPRRPVKRLETSQDGLMKALAEVGVETIKKATKRVEGQAKPLTKAGVALRGGWIISGDIVTLSGGQINSDDARIMAARLGDGFKHGQSNACPLRPVLRELSRGNVLIEPVLSAWKSLESGNESETGSAA